MVLHFFLAAIMRFLLVTLRFFISAFSFRFFFFEYLARQAFCLAAFSMRLQRFIAAAFFFFSFFIFFFAFFSFFFFFFAFFNFLFF